MKLLLLVGGNDYQINIGFIPDFVIREAATQDCGEYMIVRF